MNKKFNTVIEKYNKEEFTKNSSFSPSFYFYNEQEVENNLIKVLKHQGYEYLKLPNDNHFDFLCNNLKAQLENLNSASMKERLGRTTFTDEEWMQIKRLLLIDKGEIRESIQQKASYDYQAIIDRTRIFTTKRVLEIRVTNKKGEEESFNLFLFNQKELDKNKLQVINQYKVADGNARFDVTILVNGFPLVHIELKKEDIILKKAFDQINSYQQDGFSKTPLFQYVHIFIISNFKETRYYSNTALEPSYEGREDEKSKRKRLTWKSTAHWTDQENNRIDNLYHFAQTFLSPNTLLNIISNYCVLSNDDKKSDVNESRVSLLILRPYQITAIERMLEKTIYAIENNSFDSGMSTNAGGYIWHSTGSGKTLTSFVATQQIVNLKGIDHVLFVVDRRDLDQQTCDEYNNYSGDKDAVDTTKETNLLQRKLFNLDKGYKADSGKKVIVTTIQKLYNFIKKTNGDKLKLLNNKKFVIVFDECHRSVFGEMVAEIKQKINNRIFFGFTGTPIFSANFDQIECTENIFGERLHKYDLLAAIRDESVLGFIYDPVLNLDESVESNKEYLKSISRQREIVKHILKRFDNLTLRASSKETKIENKRKEGYCALFAVGSKEDAISYYNLFKEEQRCLDKDNKLNITTIFTAANRDGNGIEDEYDDIEKDTIEAQQEGSTSAFFERVISDYNEMTNSTFGVNEKNNFFKDVPVLLRKKKIDLVIVVRMLLTGYNNKELNTLFIDKTFNEHDLIQAFSRTNRVHNQKKQFGNIVSFRNLNETLDKAGYYYANGGDIASLCISPEVVFKQFIENVKEFKVLTNNFALEEFTIEDEKLIKLFNLIKRDWKRLFCFLDGFMDRVNSGEAIISHKDYLRYSAKHASVLSELKELLNKEESKKYEWAQEIVLESKGKIHINLDYLANQARSGQYDEILRTIEVGLNKGEYEQVDSFVTYLKEKTVENDASLTSDENFNAFWEKANKLLKKNKNIKGKSFDEIISDFCKENFLIESKFKRFLIRAYKEGYVGFGSSFSRMFTSKENIPITNEQCAIFDKKVQQHFNIVKPYLKNIVDNDRVSTWI